MINKLTIAKLLLFIPDKIFNKILFRLRLGYWPNFEKPSSLNEFINHIKLYSKNPLRKLVADRIKVRSFVKEKAPECELINILWSGETFTKEIYNNLPVRFVIKANHGSGMVIVVNKMNINFEEIFYETEKWKKIDYGIITRQFVYNDLPKTIIVEEFINFNSKVAPDYKFMCVNGNIEFIQIDIDRFNDHTKLFYNENFEPIILNEKNVNFFKPKLFNEAKNIVNQLSQDFDFIRVDLYILQNTIYFGELTNTPGNGFSKEIPTNLDLKIGEKLFFRKEFTNE